MNGTQNVSHQDVCHHGNPPVALQKYMQKMDKSLMYRILGVTAIIFNIVSSEVIGKFFDCL